MVVPGEAPCEFRLSLRTKEGITDSSPSKKRCPDLQKEVLRGQIKLFAFGWFVDKAPHARR